MLGRGGSLTSFERSPLSVARSFSSSPSCSPELSPQLDADESERTSRLSQGLVLRPEWLVLQDRFVPLSSSHPTSPPLDDSPSPLADPFDTQMRLSSSTEGPSRSRSYSARAGLATFVLLPRPLPIPDPPLTRLSVQVYLAQDQTSGRLFALKKIRCPLGSESVKAALKEVEGTCCSLFAARGGCRAQGASLMITKSCSSQPTSASVTLTSFAASTASSFRIRRVRARSSTYAALSLHP